MEETATMVAVRKQEEVLESVEVVVLQPSPSHLMTLDGTEVALCDTEQLTVVCFLRHLA